MQDLESSLYYSLWIEVGGHAVIEGGPLDALKNHMLMLSKVRFLSAPSANYPKFTQFLIVYFLSGSITLGSLISRNFSIAHTTGSRMSLDP